MVNIRFFKFEELEFNPNDILPGIKNPITNISYPINIQLKNIYNKCKDGLDISAEIELHKKRFELLESIYVRDWKHSEIMYLKSRNLHFNHQNFDEPSNTKSEFYAVVNFNKNLRAKVKATNEFRFHEYLEILESTGNGAEDRVHSTKKDVSGSGNQAEMAKRWNSDLESFIRINSETNKFKDFNEYKESCSFSVYNVGNMLNSNFTKFVKPIELNQNCSEDEFRQLIISCGIFTLYQNYLIMKSRYLNQENSESLIKNNIIQRQSKIDLKEHESRNLLIYDIAEFKKDLDLNHVYWKVELNKMALEKPDNYKQQSMILLDNNVNKFNNMIYTEILLHYTFVRSVFYKFKRDETKFSEI